MMRNLHVFVDDLILVTQLGHLVEFLSLQLRHLVDFVEDVKFVAPLDLRPEHAVLLVAADVARWQVKMFVILWFRAVVTLRGRIENRWTVKELDRALLHHLAQLLIQSEICCIFSELALFMRSQIVH